VITIHTFNKFVEEISDEDKETKLMQLNNSEERVLVKKRYVSTILLETLMRNTIVI
jgi:hypothetical protein